MNEEKDFFTALTEAEVYEGPSFETPPVNAWVLGKTTSKDNGGWAPKLRNIVPSAESKRLPTLALALIVQGGEDAIVPEKHQGNYIPLEIIISPSDRDKGPIPGRMMGFLNNIFAQGVAEGEKDTAKRTAARNAVTTAKLTALSKSTPLLDGEVVTKAKYNTPAFYFAALTASYLNDNPVFLLAKTKDASYVNKQTGEKRNEGKVEAGATEDYTLGNKVNRKVTAFPDKDTGIVPTPFEPAGAGVMEY